MVKRRLWAVALALSMVLTYMPALAFAEDDPALPENEALAAEEAGVESGYDRAFFDAAKKTLDEMGDEATNVEIIREAYRLSLRSAEGAEKADGMEASTALLSDLLLDRGIENLIIKGKDAEGEDAKWLIARVSEGEPFYILRPDLDIGAENDADLKGCLVGAEYAVDLVPDEEFTGEDFEAEYPVSSEKYTDPETAAEEQNGEAAEQADAAVEASETAEAEEEGKEDAEEDEKIYGASDYTVASGSCGYNAKWRVSRNDNYEYTLTIYGNGSMSNYSSSSMPWYSYRYSISKLVIDKNITSIGDYAFYNLPYLTSVKFSGSSVSKIGKSAFRSCSSLKKISLPANLTYIYESAFMYCYSLESVSMPASLVDIEMDAFYGDYALSTVYLPEKIKYLGSWSLWNVGDVYYPGNSSGWESINGPRAVSSNTNVHFARSIKGASVKFKLKTYVFSPNGITPNPVVKLKVGGKTLTLAKDKDYKLSYKNNKKVGKATVTIKGTKNYYGSISKTYTITRRSLAKAKVSGVKNQIYTGKARKISPVVKLKIGKKYVKLKNGRDYVIKYRNNRKLSTSKTKATATIVGKGNYKGKIKKTFKIVKGGPGLRFSKKAIKRTTLAGSFTSKVKRSTKGKINITYSSSNPSVATVNKKTGKVTPRRVGTTTITARSKATKLYKAGKTSYKLTLRPLERGELRYSFANYQTYYIPESTFRLFYNGTQARLHYNKEWHMGQWGVCFGMSTSSAMMKIPGTGIKPNQFSAKAKNPVSLNGYNRFNSKGSYLYDLIEAMHVSQSSAACQKQIKGNKGKVSALASQVRSGVPAIVCIRGRSGGHAVVGYKIKKINKKVDHLYVYDCNYPGSGKYIKLYKKNGRYTNSWYYDSYYSSPYSITYISGKAYRSIWKNRRSAGKLTQLYISSASFAIYNGEGEKVAEMKDGEFSSTSDDIYLAESFGPETESNLVFVPSGEYTVENTASDGSEFEVTSMDEKQGITVSTDAGSVTVETDDESGVNLAKIEAGEAEEYTVSIVDGTGNVDNPEEIVMTGEAGDKTLTLGMDDGDCVMKNAEGATLEIDGKEMEYEVSKGIVTIK